MNRGIPDDVVEEVRSRANIVEVINHVVTLRKAGNGSWKACCPFHQEKTPSFTVSEARERYHCFGCGAGGDVFKFVMEYEHVDFPTSVRMLADRVGVIIPETGNTPADRAAARAGKDERERLYGLLEDFTGFFQRNLARNPSSAVAKYLATRELDPETVKKFRIGAAPDSWDAGLEYGRKNGYTESEMLAAGVVLQNEETRRLYDRFRNRLVFPIWNEVGKVVGFSARTVEREPAGAKYVNSPETPVFKKSRLLYALPLARPAIGEEKMAVLCEGQLDVIAMHRGGCRCAVAPQGTAFTEEQARMLRRYTDKVLLAFDSDSAGQKAVLRAFEILFEQNFEVKVILMPPGDDPDSVFRKTGAEGIKNMVENAVDVLDFLVRTLRKNFDMTSPYEQSRFLTSVLEYLEKFPNAVVRENYMRKLAEMLNLNVELVYAEMNNIRRARRRSHRPAAAPAPALEKRPAASAFADRELLHAERTLLELMLVNEEIAHLIAERVDASSLSTSPVGRAINRAAALTANGEYGEVAHALNELDRENGDELLSSILTTVCPIPPENQRRAFDDCEAVFERRKSERRLTELTERLKSAATPEAKAAILRQIQEIE